MTILISISIQRNVKYLLSTEFYEKLKRKFNIILLVAFKCDDDFERLYGGINVKIIPAPKTTAEENVNSLKKIFMKYLLFSMDFNLAKKPLGKHNLFLKKKMFPARYYSFKFIHTISCFWFSRKMCQKLCNIVFHDKNIDSLFKATMPSLIISTSPAKMYLDYCLQQSAIGYGIPLVFYPDSWDNFTTSGHLPFHPDRLLSWGPEMTRHAVEFIGMSKEKIANVGLVRMESSNNAKLDRRSLHRYFNIPDDHRIILAATNKTYMGVALPRILEELLQDMSDGKIERATLVIRPANSRQENIDAYVNRFKDHPLVRINLPENDGKEEWAGEKPVDWRQIIAGVDAIITVCSMMILEAFYYGTPVVNPDYNYGMLNNYGFDYTFYYNREVFKKIKELGGTTMAKDREGLVRALNAYLSDPGLHQGRRARVMEQWDVLPTPPETRSSTALREIENLLATQKSNN